MKQNDSFKEQNVSFKEQNNSFKEQSVSFMRQITILLTLVLVLVSCNKKSEIIPGIVMPQWQDIGIQEYLTVPQGSIIGIDPRNNQYTFRLIDTDIMASLIFKLLEAPTTILTKPGYVHVSNFKWALDTPLLINQSIMSSYLTSEDKELNNNDVALMVDPDVFMRTTGGDIKSVYLYHIRSKLRQTYELKLRMLNPWIEHVSFEVAEL